MKIPTLSIGWTRDEDEQEGINLQFIFLHVVQILY